MGYVSFMTRSNHFLHGQLIFCMVLLEKGYQDLIWAGKITLAKLKPLENVKEYASKLYKLFLKKAEALEVSSFLEIHDCFFE